MAIIYGPSDGTPIADLDRSLRGFHLPAQHGPNCADLLIMPLGDERHAGAWYEVFYAHKILCPTAEHDDEEDLRMSCWERGHVDLGCSPVEYLLLECATVLPAPPVIPWQERLAQEPHPSIDHLSDEEIRVWYGTPAEAMEAAKGRQRFAIQEDRTARIFDWNKAAPAYREILEKVPHRKLTPAERVRVGEAALREAEWNLANRQRSLEDLRANAAKEKK